MLKMIKYYLKLNKQSLRDTKENVRSAIDSLNQCKDCEIRKFPSECEHRKAML